MKQPVPEFSRPLRVDRVPRGGSHEKIAADAKECAALARRLGVPALYALSAHLVAAPWRGGGLRVEGTLTADLDQISVVSLAAFRSTASFPVSRFYLPPGAPAGAEEDVDEIANGHVDLGEAVAETLALELDPYPRRDGEDFASAADAAEPPAPEPQSPFAALSKLKPKRNG